MTAAAPLCPRCGERPRWRLRTGRLRSYCRPCARDVDAGGLPHQRELAAWRLEQDGAGPQRRAVERLADLDDS